MRWATTTRGATSWASGEAKLQLLVPLELTCRQQRLDLALRLRLHPVDLVPSSVMQLNQLGVQVLQNDPQRLALLWIERQLFGEHRVQVGRRRHRSIWPPRICRAEHSEAKPDHAAADKDGDHAGAGHKARGVCVHGPARSL